MQLASLGVAIGTLGKRLPTQQAAAGAKQIVAAMEKTTDSEKMVSLGGALFSLGEKLPQEQAVAGAERLFAARKTLTVVSMSWGVRQMGV